MSVCLACVWCGSGVGDDDSSRCVLRGASSLLTNLRVLSLGAPHRAATENESREPRHASARAPIGAPRTENPLPSPPPINDLCIAGRVGHASVHALAAPVLGDCWGSGMNVRCVVKEFLEKPIAEIRGRRIQCWLFLRLLRRCSHCTQRRERCRQQHTRSGGRRFGPDWRPLPPLLCRS